MVRLRGVAQAEYSVHTSRLFQLVQEVGDEPRFTTPRLLGILHGVVGRVRELPGVGRSSGRKTSPFSLDFDSLGALGGQNFTSQIVPLGFRRWTLLTRLCDQKHGSRAPWGASENK